MRLDEESIALANAYIHEQAVAESSLSEEQMFAGLSEKEQLDFLRRKFGRLTLKAQETNTQEKSKAPG